MMNQYLQKHLVPCWIVISVCAFLLQSLTISFLPGIGQDEVQITDYGRLAINPYSDWSMTWMMAEEKPLLLWSYLGPLIAELSFHIGGPSGIGPRIASLLGGLLSATMILGWLLSRQVPRLVALCLSVAFLLDPLFTLSQRMGRVDSWVIALCLASCWLLRSSNHQKGTRASLQVFLAGVLTATASLVWPSAFLLYPLILLELWELLPSKHVSKEWLLQILTFITGGIFILILLIIPIRSTIYLLVSDLQNMMTLNVNTERSTLERTASIFDLNNWLKLVKAFVKTFSPMLPLLAILSLFYRRYFGLKFVTLLTLFVIFSTLIYEFRLLYLFPYFAALAGGIYISLPEGRSVNGMLNKISKAALIVTTVWAIVVSIFIRSGYALSENAYDDRNKINYAAETLIGKGPHKVFLAYTYELYFSGRNLGWELYTPYIQFGYDSVGNWTRDNDYKPKDKFAKLLSKMDYAIFQKGYVSKEINQQLIESGLHYKNTVFVNDPKNNLDFQSARSHYILFWFLLGYKDYGPYLLYERDKDLEAIVQ